jgi:radical S-adenosyl methionine domain-containing protein 2
VYNWNEDVAGQIEKLSPLRLKVFQCLVAAGENDTEDKKRDARTFLMTDEQ